MSIIPDIETINNLIYDILAALEQQEEKEKVGETLTKERAKAILI